MIDDVVGLSFVYVDRSDSKRIASSGAGAAAKTADASPAAAVA
ncbi:hypothetical protein [Caballeronia sp. LZ033]|nr:hypothetical protein [Caballeronia sp. LZ033]